MNKGFNPLTFVTCKILPFIYCGEQGLLRLESAVGYLLARIFTLPNIRPSRYPTSDHNIINESRFGNVRDILDSPQLYHIGDVGEHEIDDMQ